MSQRKKVTVAISLATLLIAGSVYSNAAVAQNDASARRAHERQPKSQIGPGTSAVEEELEPGRHGPDCSGDGGRPMGYNIVNRALRR